MRATLNDQRLNARRYAWVGARNASQSIMLWNGTERRRNLFANPRGGNSVGWGTFGGGGGVVVHTGITGVTDHPAGVGTARRATWTTGPTVAIGGAYWLDNPVTAGLTYTASVWVRPSVTQNMRLGIEFRNAANTAISTSVGVLVACTAGEWTRLSSGGTATDNSSTVTCTAYPSMGSVPWPTGATLDATGALVEEGATLRPYFDGDTQVDAATINQVMR